MATLTVTKFVCDRCKCVLDKAPIIPSPRITVKIEIEIEEEWSYQTHVWREICSACNIDLLSKYKRLLPERQDETK